MNKQVDKIPQGQVQSASIAYLINEKARENDKDNIAWYKYSI